MKNLILLAAFFLCLSCSNDDNGTNEDLTITLVGQGSLHASSIEQKNYVVTNKFVWEALKAKMNALNGNYVRIGSLETEIDFSKYQIIAAFYKQNSNSSSTIDITKATARSGKIYIKVENLQFGITNDIMQPYHIVKIPRSSKKIVFE